MSLNLLSSVTHAEEKKEPPSKPELPVARIIAPLVIPVGSNLPIRIRGDHLDKAKKMILELGDVMWYVMQACKGLDTTLEHVVQCNVTKLSKRHDGGFKKDYKS